MMRIGQHLRKIGLIGYLSMVAASTVNAQDFSIDTHEIDRCLAMNDHTPMECVGRQADLCYNRNSRGADMILSACRSAELAFWDKALNEVYQELLRLTADAQTSDVGYEPNQLTDAAREMQRSWITYRDATCWLDVARVYPFGSAAGPADSGCQLRETARQYIQLQNIAGDYRH